MTDITKMRQISTALRPKTDVAAVERLWTILTEMTPEEQHRFWIRDPKAGQVCLFEHESAPGVVLEYVAGSKQDSVSTLYEAATVVGSKQALIDVRTFLITEIAVIFGGLPSAMGFHDAGRGRDVFLREMGTAQLLDELARLMSLSLEAIA